MKLPSVIGDKWTMKVLIYIEGVPKRFSQIRRNVDGISSQMLNRSLRILERDGMVTRTSFPTSRPWVEYELRPLGLSLLAPITALGKWAVDHTALIDAARAEFDARSSLDGCPAPVPSSQRH